MQPARITSNERVEHDPSLRLYDDTTTWLAEVLDGSMRTHFSYSFDGRELYGHDNSPLKPIFKDALTDAEKLAANQPNLAFELRRRWLEMGEYKDMVAMAKGDLPNTMVVVSDFPPELIDSREDIGGYNVGRKQTMLRVISRCSDGSLTMYSQSLDGSNRIALESVCNSLGFEAEAGELLGQRMHINLSAEDQPFLIDKLMGNYDRSLAEQFGGEWYAGRTPAEILNTYDFVRKQDDLLKSFMDTETQCEDESLLYNLAAAIRRRFSNRHATKLPAEIPPPGVTVMPNPLSEMYWAGALARAEGQTFSGCGISLRQTIDGMSTPDQLAEAGYGNKAGPEASYRFDKHMYCVVCQPTPKKEEPKRMCGPCGICRFCDVKLKKESQQ